MFHKTNKKSCNSKLITIISSFDCELSKGKHITIRDCLRINVPPAIFANWTSRSVIIDPKKEDQRTSSLFSLVLMYLCYQCVGL